MKINRHGQAVVLSQNEIELLFAEGLQSDRERVLFGVCLYTAARIAEACSMLSEDVYTPGGKVRSSVNIRKAATKGKLATRTIPVIEDLRIALGCLATSRWQNLFIPRPASFPSLAAHYQRLGGATFQGGLQAYRNRRSFYPQF
jgi:hypothetical protein